MVDIYLKKYKSGDATSGYNAPHKYRFSFLQEAGKDDILRIWKQKKNAILKEFVSKMKEIIVSENKTAFALAPSNTVPFTKDIEEYLEEHFPLAINISSCFAKTNGENAISLKTQLTNEELRLRYELNESCFKEKMNDEINQIILADDIFALGNTFNAMKLLISDIDKNIEIKTAVILNTNNE